MSFFAPTSRDTRCSKCGGNLVASDIHHVIPWIDQKKEEISQQKIGGKKVDVYECDKCGYLEFYEHTSSNYEFGRF